ncbi:unnamed protein product [Lactuca virosa]|uniref:Alliinase C-terminal domain-containing protein n=1 Tax=Lactuca virosa TaxID=75947 RepID=A0AAU9P841_9ASTR|nr:unnamed protein product [Lactuca virosa]
MEKTKKYCYGFCLLSSIVINILFSINLYVGGGGGALQWGEKKHETVYRPSLTWSEKAAAEAEAVAAISCSGHGRAYLDSLISYGQTVCECYDCYGGTDCSEFSPDCSADAGGGDPIFLEPFWMQNAEKSAIVVSGWHRMSYRYADYTMIAAVYALSSENSSSPSNVVATIPYYPMYETQTSFFNSEDFQFEGDTNSWKLNNATKNNMDVIEFVTSPNNPDGELKTSVLGGKTIYDHAYLWPHFTPIPGPSDHDLMIFTLSKLTGHAAVRFGWAVIKDKDVYEKVSKYMEVADLGISKDTQLRVLKLLKVVVEDDGKQLFKFAYAKMRERWDRLTSVFSKSTRFSIQERHPLHCNFFNKTRLPSPAYAWVKCEREEEDDCGAVLEAGKIASRGGSTYKAKDRYARLSLIKSQDDFDLLLLRLTELMSLENGKIESI